MFKAIQSILLLLALLGALGIAPAYCETPEHRPPLPFDEWVLGPDRSDFAWKVHLFPAQLTFQQRYLEQVRVTIPSDTLKNESAQRDLHFLVKVADEHGKWFEPESYTHYSVPPDLDRKHELQFGVGLYIQPGQYTFAVLAYDSVSGQGNLWRGQLHISAVKNDPLPQLGRNLPIIEFIDAFPQDTVVTDSENWLHGSRMKGGKWTRPMLSDPAQPTFVLSEAENNGEAWDLGDDQPWLPVSTPYPVHIDLVLNFSERIDPYFRQEDPSPVYRMNIGRLLQISNLLGHLQLTNGCVHLSVLDMLRMQTILEPVEATTVNWHEFEEVIRKRDRNTIEIGTLKTRTNASAFVRDSLANIISDSERCDFSGAQPLHVVLIAVSSGLQFPSGTKIEYVQPDQNCKCRIYYLRPQSGSQGLEDDLERMLKPVRPHRLSPATPLDFRKDLAAFISDIEAVSRAEAAIHQREPRH